MDAAVTVLFLGIVIFQSILVCSVMVFLLERTPFSRVYQRLFWSFGKEAPVA